MMVTGVKYIGVFLKENYTLKVIPSTISDVGISQIADGIQANTSLTELNVTDQQKVQHVIVVTLEEVVYLICTHSPLGLMCTCQIKHNHMCYK